MTDIAATRHTVPAEAELAHEPPPQISPGRVRLLTATALLCAAATVGCVVAMFTLTDRVAIGSVAMVLMLLLMALRVPVSISMIATGLLGIYVLAGERALTSSLRDYPFRTMGDWQLSVLPMFILMGLVMWRSGITAQVFRAAEKWLARLPGGLGVATNFAGAGMASVSGSTLGISYALGRIAIPEMLRAGYDKRLATGVVTMAGTLGQLIPPSILLVVYAGVAQVPIGDQLLAAIVPGVILAMAYAVTVIAHATLKPSSAPRVNRQVTWAEKFSSLAGVWPLPLLLLVILGGLYSGVFTATEAGACAAALACFAAVLVSRRKFWKHLYQSSRDTVISTAAILFLLIGVGIINRFLALSGVATAFADLIEGLPFGRVGFLLVLVLFYLVLGTFMEPLGMILLTVPVFAPTLAALDINLLWFGVFLIIMGEIAIISPPVGVLLFIIYQMARDPEVNVGHEIRMADVLRGTLPFLAAALVVVGILIVAPGLTTLLTP
ncbi:TRAP transporter large permease [Plantactinospora sp. GCM10030261]|uniref:TRAP transporter large permease n=1 Tax=Plantactinospora sp. GCM10030261 TaxID=3273420 RepID=UPI00360C59C7